MKLTKKKVLVAAIAICLVATLSMGTLAWFSATDSITNKFPIADSLTSFEIDVWEIVPDGIDEGTDPDVVGRGKNGETSYEYAEGVTPGATFAKKVFVENTS